MIKHIIRLGFIYFFVIVIAFSLKSCESDDIELAHQEDIYIESNISNECFMETKIMINSFAENVFEKRIKIESAGITTKGLEQNLEELFRPFVADGAYMRDMILKNRQELNLSQEDIGLLENLTSPDLAVFSYIVNSVNISQHLSPRLKNASEEYWSTDRVISCISAALGITAIQGIIQGTGGLISASSAMAIFRSLATRYVGYIGLAVAVYEFGKCMDSY